MKLSIYIFLCCNQTVASSDVPESFLSTQRSYQVQVKGRTRCNLHKKNVRSVRFVAKRRGCCCKLTVGVVLKAQFTTNELCMKSNTQRYVARSSHNSDLVRWFLLLIAATVWKLCALTLELSDCNTRNILPCVLHAQYMEMTREKHVGYLDLAWNLATFQYIDGFGCYHFCLTRFGLELMIFFWNSLQLSVQFWDCRLLSW